MAIPAVELLIKDLQAAVRDRLVLHVPRVDIIFF